MPAQTPASSSAAPFQLLFVSHPIPMWIYDLKTLAFLDVNDAAVEKYGYAREEFLRMTLRDIRPAEEVSRLEKDVKRIRPTLQHSGLWKHQLRDGRVIDVEITSHIFEYNGRRAALVTAQDVTEHKQAETALRESEERFAALFRVNPASLAITRLSDGLLVDVNQAWEEITGYARDEAIGHTPLELNLWVNPAQRTGLVETVQKKGKTRTEVQIRRKSGEFHELLMSAEIIHLAGEHYLITMAQDITERMEAELALRASEERYRDLVENISDLICTHDLEGRLLSVNRAAVELTGYSHDELIGKSLRDFMLPENQRAFDAYLAEIQTNGNASGLMSIQTKSGERRIWEYRNTLRVKALTSPIVRGYARDITERRQAEKEVQESEKHYRALFEDVPAAVWEEDFSDIKKNIDLLKDQGITDFRGYFESHPEDAVRLGSMVKVLDMNATALQMYQAPSKEELVRIAMHMMSKGESDNNLEDLIAIAEGKTSRSWDGSDETLTGKPLEISLTWAVIPGHEKDYSRVIVTTIDITQRREAEEKLKLQSAALNASANAIVITNREGQIQWANHAFTALTGYTLLEEVFGKNPRDLIKSGRQEQKFYENLWNTILAGKVWRGELVNRRKDGTLYDEEMTITPVRDGTSKIAHFIAVKQDITERKQVETILRESEARFRGYFELPLVGFAITSPTAQWMDANSTLCQMLGYTKEELMQKTWKEITHPDDLPANLEKFNRALKGEIDNYSLEKRFIRKDGSLIHVAMAVHCLRRPDRTIDYLMSLFLDITERKQAEEKIRKMNAELEQRVEERTRELRETQEQLIQQEKLAVLGQLASGVGHELRNPLAIINNAVYFLKLVQPQADQKIKDYHTIIENETRTAEKIITDLLDFARIKSVDREVVSVSELVERVLNRFPAPPPVTVSLDIPADLPTLFVDMRQMEQVLGNLVTNACQAMPEGGQVSVISDQLSVSGEPWVRIAVKDVGVGIPPENMSKLFEPLFTTKVKGIGLGLAVSRKLVEVNGGRIEVQSEAGKGSTFTVWLPVRKEEGK